MQLTTEQIGEITIVKIQGRLDALVADNLRDSLTALLHQGCTRLLINCSEVEFLSSSSMRAFLAVAQAMQKQEGKMVFCGFSQAIQEVLRLSGVFKYFNHYPSHSDAISALSLIK